MTTQHIVALFDLLIFLKKSHYVRVIF